MKKSQTLSKDCVWLFDCLYVVMFSTVFKKSDELIGKNLMAQIVWMQTIRHVHFAMRRETGLDTG